MNSSSTKIKRALLYCSFYMNDFWNYLLKIEPTKFKKKQTDLLGFGSSARQSWIDFGISKSVSCMWYMETGGNLSFKLQSPGNGA